MKFDKLPFALIVVAVFLCFGRTLGSYFVADDFSQVAYVESIFKGDFNSLFSTLTGNYLQNPVMKIYRPCLLLSLMLDYSIWHVNAFGYFLTNIVLLILAACMLYILLRELTINWTKSRSIWFAGLSALLFATNPLHCESISFISGRDNIISACFGLFSLWCFINKKARSVKRFIVIGVASFVLSLFSKEMAIGLPVVLMAIGFFFPENFVSKSDDDAIAQKETINSRFASGLKVSLPLWLAAAVCLVLRFVMLGTFTGGYTGGVGAGLLSNMIKRWSDFDTVYRLIVPLNIESFGSGGAFQACFVSLYAAIVALVVSGLTRRNLPLRWIGLWLVWTMTTVIPLYQLWGLGANLAGARFFFFFSIPQALMLPILIFAPPECDDRRLTSVANNGSSTLQNAERVAIVCLSALIVLSAGATYRNNLPWLHAGKQARACLIEGQRLAKGVPNGKKIAILGLPNDESGAHIIYNGATFDAMMSPPFAEESLSKRLVTFEPLFFGRPEFINPDRLKTILDDPETLSLMVWNRQKLCFAPVDAPIHQFDRAPGATNNLAFQPDKTLLTSVTASLGLSENPSSETGAIQYQRLRAESAIDPYSFDFLEFTVKGKSAKEPFFVLWRGVNSDWSDLKNPVEGLVQNATAATRVRVRLSDRWTWFTSGRIAEIKVEFLPDQAIEISDMQLVSGRRLLPKMQVVRAQASNLGFYLPSKEGTVLAYNVSEEANAEAIKFEISKPNYSFDGLSEQEAEQAVMTTLVKSGNAGTMTFAGNLFKSPGYYQIRGIALDKTGKPVGEMSQPVTVSL